MVGKWCQIDNTPIVFAYLAQTLQLLKSNFGLLYLNLKDRGYFEVSMVVDPGVHLFYRHLIRIVQKVNILEFEHFIQYLKMSCYQKQFTLS